MYIHPTGTSLQSLVMIVAVVGFILLAACIWAMIYDKNSPTNDDESRGGHDF